jgi:acyl-coenzyme A synthetase/AMP-(fatty) acid ligase
MIPKSIEFRTSLPKTDSGKIRRSEVQAEELRKAAEARPTTNDEGSTEANFMEAAR